MALGSVSLARFFQTRALTTLVVFALHHDLKILLTWHPVQLQASALGKREVRAQETPAVGRQAGY